MGACWLSDVLSKGIEQVSTLTRKVQSSVLSTNKNRERAHERPTFLTYTVPESRKSRFSGYQVRHGPVAACLKWTTQTRVSSGICTTFLQKSCTESGLTRRAHSFWKYMTLVSSSTLPTSSFIDVWSGAGWSKAHFAFVVYSPPGALGLSWRWPLMLHQKFCALYPISRTEGRYAGKAIRFRNLSQKNVAFHSQSRGHWNWTK